MTPLRAGAWGVLFHAMTIFSPSQTDLWHECPVKRQLSRAGFYSTIVSHSELAALLGSAIAAGVEEYHAWLVGRPEANQEIAPTSLVQGATTQAGMTVTARLQEWTAAGRRIPDWDRPYTEQLWNRATNATAAYIAARPIRPEWVVVAVEHVLPSGSRLDLGVRAPLGPLVLDLKTKLTLNAHLRDRVVEEYEISPQLYHYAWEWGHELGEPVRHAGILLFILEPKPTVELVEIPIDACALETWRQSSERAWLDMEAEDAGERLALQRRRSCHTGFGRCGFYRACHAFFEEVELMVSSGEYLRIPRAGAGEQGEKSL